LARFGSAYLQAAATDKKNWLNRRKFGLNGFKVRLEEIFFIALSNFIQC
jgi:hypothetical protein